MAGIAATSACAGYPTCDDYGRDCGGSTGGKAGQGGSAGASVAGGSNDAGEGGASAMGGSASGTSGKGGTSQGGNGDSGGKGRSAAGAGGGGNCDTTKSPNEESCLVSDELAVFVAPDGNDDKNDGSKAAPFATLTKAVATAGEKVVLVCDATYDEHVSITSGARVYGGFKCTDWSAEAAKPLFKPTTAGTALKVDTVTAEVMIDSVRFEVGDAVAAGETALTAMVNASPKVTLRAVSLTAGKGKAGANGSLAIFTLPDRSALDGNNANGTTGGLPKVVQCPGGAETAGGVGGTASPTGQAGGDGSPVLAADKGKGGVPGGCAAGLGGDGANAPDAPPATGAATPGTLTPLVWSTGSGANGQNGSPGQGGGGGASSKTGGGGGGGAGACGGAGAKGGQGGGASIALAVVSSSVTLQASALLTADAGDGGKSVAGQPGGKSESGFAGNPGPGACQGGAGGLGGNGGAGGGGAGGISVGILWKGPMAPTVSPDTTITNGNAGTKGTGGVPGTNDGIAGVSQKVLNAP